LDETITLEKQYGTIAEFLTKVESAGNLFISYGNNTVPSSNYIQIEGGNKKIREFLDEILAGIPVTYSVKMRRISLVPGPLFQTIRGNVKDIDPVVPLSVQIYESLKPEHWKVLYQIQTEIFILKMFLLGDTIYM